MNITDIPFCETGFFSKTACDYLDASKSLEPYYNRFPKIENFKEQITEKRNSSNNSLAQRQRLVSVLEQQYEQIEASGETVKNIQLLLKENTFTITTGHQLNLFTGPLYFLYKIISAINLCEELTAAYPNENFVPIYWMASEDHDFDEINYFNFKGKKVQWNSEEFGGVGRFSTKGLEAILKEFSKHLGNSKNAIHLKELFSEGYLHHDNLADATRYIANELFKDYGLVIVDADDATLKQDLIPYIKRDLLEQVSFKEVSKTITNLEKDYKIQVNPREINLFYLVDGLRERIVFKNDVYKVNNTDISWDESAILEEVDNHPERFSPNVIIRPLFQEVVLPNLCYIGGGGELAYWFELKKYFEAVGVTFPILLLRNSVQVISEKQANKLAKLDITKEELFLKQNDLIAKKIKERAVVTIDFTDQKLLLQEQFNFLKEVAEKTDASFIGAVNAQEKKQIKGLENLEKRLLRAEKRKQKELVDAITFLQNEILPNESLEERQRNFSEYYLEYGSEFITVLKDNLKPLDLTFTVLTL